MGKRCFCNKIRSTLIQTSCESNSSNVLFHNGACTRYILEILNIQPLSIISWNIKRWLFKWLWIRNSYSASAGGSQEEGTSCFTCSDSVRWDLTNSILYKVMNQPSKARSFVEDASFCQHPLWPNIALNNPEGILPDRDSSWFNCSDIWMQWADDRAEKVRLVRYAHRSRKH